MRTLFVFAALLVGCHARETPAPQAPTTTSATLPPPVEPSVVPESNEAPRDGERVVAKLRPRFRSCYERGLLEGNRAMSGVVALHLRVAPDGTVRSVEIAKREGLSGTVAACIARQAQGATFEPPGPGGAALDVPVHLVRSNVAAH